ncbi:MAG: hypothetical protein ABIS13_03065 [Nitrosospira sp.]
MRAGNTHSASSLPDLKNRSENVTGRSRVGSSHTSACLVGDYRTENLRSWVFEFLAGVRELT